MCDFKPGDEVVCVDASGDCGLSQGGSYVVTRLLVAGDVVETVLGPRSLPPTATAQVWVAGGRDFTAVLRRAPDGKIYIGYRADRFRKVQRRNTDLSIESFLTIKPGFEEPKRTPAKKREVAQ